MPLSPSERQWRAVTTLTWPAALGGAPLLLAMGAAGGPPLCLFRLWTGQPCPLCGGTHACAALAHADLAAAWQASPSAMPLLALAAVHTAQLAFEAWTGREVAARWRIGRRPWAAAAALTLLLWGLRVLGLV
jgi:hypothetical protein